MQIHLILICIVATSEAALNLRIEKAFQSFSPSLKLQVGTPPQWAQLVFGLRASPNNSRIEMPWRVLNDGVFDPDLSTTFKNRMPIRKNWHDGVNGTDSILFNGTKTVAPGFHMDVLNMSDGRKWNISFNPHGTVGFGRSAPNQPATFIETVFAAFPSFHRSVVFAFEKTTFLLMTGRLAIGDPTPKYCGNQWIVGKEAPHKSGSQFAFELDELNVGTVQSIKPGTAAIFGETIGVPKELFNPILYALDGWLTKDDGYVHVDCDVAVVMRFGVGGKVLEFKPDDYLMKWPGSHCRIQMGITTNRTFILPQRIINQRCLRYDYARLELGIAEIIDQK